MRPKSTIPCSDPDCGRAVYGYGLCNLHYQRWRKTPEGKAFKEANETPGQRFWNRVDPCRTDGCALYLGPTSESGYGYFAGGLAHHFLVGKPPKGMEWDHVRERGCTNRNCVWPGHLELVSRQENIRRQEHHGPALKEMCKNGHPYDVTNTRILPGGRRQCRMCTHEATRRWRARQKTM